MPLAKKSLLGIRLGCLLVTVIGISFVFYRVRPAAMIAAFRSMHPGWFLSATLLYGLLFLPASWRWHLALRLGAHEKSFGVTSRYSLIGHFFYTILFGAAGGDFAKCALYARRYHRPLPAILAAASVDRLLGFCGLILFVGLAFGVAAAHGALRRLESVSFAGPVRWLILIAAVLVLLVALFRRSPRGSSLKQFSKAFAANTRKLMASPRTLIAGVTCGFLVQLTLSAVLALNLQAVSPSPLPWMQLLWTFPLISIAGAVPITIAGLGTRESAALALLSFCGVAGNEAVAASLLSAGGVLVWAVIGGLLFGREMNWRWAAPVEELLLKAEENPSGDSALESGRLARGA